MRLLEDAATLVRRISRPSSCRACLIVVKLVCSVRRSGAGVRCGRCSNMVVPSPCPVRLLRLQLRLPLRSLDCSWPVDGKQKTVTLESFHINLARVMSRIREGGRDVSPDSM